MLRDLKMNRVCRSCKTSYVGYSLCPKCFAKDRMRWYVGSNRKKNLTSVDKQVIRDLYKANISIREMLRVYPVSKSAIERYAYGKDRPKAEARGRVKVNDTIAEEIRRRRKQEGLFYRELAEIYGIQLTTVYYICKSTFWSRKCLRDGCVNRIEGSVNITNDPKLDFCSSKCFNAHVRECKVEFERKMKEIRGEKKCLDSKCNNQVHSDHKKFCSDKCRWRHYGRRKREESINDGKCPQCKGSWVEPEETHKGKPKHCRNCQRYYRERYEKSRED